MNPREEILALLQGKKISNQPAFSGLIHVTAEGLQTEGLRFPEVHKDAHKMAKAATSTFRLTGMPSATLPLDLCATAETMGAELDFFEEGEYRFPQVKGALVESTRVLASGGLDLARAGRGRLDIIDKAIGITAKEIGSEAVIAGMLPGPYTLLLYLCNPQMLFVEMKKEPEMVSEALRRLGFFLAKLGEFYRDIGTDYLTFHEMGGSPGFLGPARFEQFVFPVLKQVIAETPKPVVLSVCGNVNRSLALLNETGAKAVSLDQTADLPAARAALNDTLLFGNIDPVGTLWQGDKARITAAVRGAQEAGVDAVWPGCDLSPQTPIDNLKTFVEAG